MSTSKAMSEATNRTQDEWKFHTPVARLYRLLGVENGVRTPDGIGTLVKAHSYPNGCQVVLMRETQRIGTSRRNPTGYQIMQAYDHQEVEKS